MFWKSPVSSKRRAKLNDGRVLVRRGRLVLGLQLEELGPDDEVIPETDPISRKKGRLRVVVEAWRDNPPSGTTD
jgi:hypothetical protein